MPPHPPPALRRALEIAALAAIYFMAARLGLLFAFEKTNATPVWPCSGVALAALLLRGQALWPGIWIGAFLANVTVFLQHGVGSPALLALVSAVIAAGNSLEAVSGRFLIERFIAVRSPLEREGDVVKFLAVAAFVSAVAASVGPSALCISALFPWSLYRQIWFTWWLGDIAGILVVTPMILALSRAAPFSRDGGTFKEAALMLGLLFVAAKIVFGPWLLPAAAHYPLDFVVLPLLVWAALRLGPAAASSAVALLCGIAVWGTVRGYGPFVRHEINASLLLLESFIGVVSVTILAMTAVVGGRQRAQRDLRQAHRELEEGFRRLIDSVKDYAIFRLDPDGRVASWNAGAERIKGYKPEEIIGRHFSCFYPPEERRAGKPQKHLREAADAGRLEEEGWRVRKDGSWFWASTVITAITDSAGRLAGFAKVTRDITERRRAQEALRQKSEELARSNAELSQFASIASHDLQEPLRKVSAFSAMLSNHLKDALDEQGRDYIERIEKAVTTMTKLIEDLLILARITAKPPPLENVELEAVARDVLSDLEPRIAESGGKVEVGSLPALTADPSQMRQLLQNLIGNGLKFRRKGEAPLVRVEARELEGGFIEIRVEDNGVGFEEKYLDRLFKPFQRLHSRAEYPGTGMGLAICGKIVSRHGGRLTARSSPGKGSQFIVTLPRTPG